MSRALRVDVKAAGPEALGLRLAMQELPSPEPGEAIVRVRAAAINPSDVKATLGLMPQAVWPRTPGRDFAGVVVEGPAEWLGRDVFGSGGDLGITRDGSHAAYLRLPVDALHAKPRRLGMDEAGAVGVPFVTAYEGFRRAGMPQPGQVVLVLGANGKVGQAAVQLAAAGGAAVVAVQRRGGRFDGHAIGHVDVVDATTEDIATRVRELSAGRGADIVFNTVGSAYFAQANQAMAKGGTQIFIATHDRAVPFDIFAFYRGMHTYVGIDSLALDSVTASARLAAMSDAFENDVLRPFPIARAFRLDDAEAAYRAVLGGSADRMVFNP